MQTSTLLALLIASVTAAADVTAAAPAPAAKPAVNATLAKANATKTNATKPTAAKSPLAKANTTKPANAAKSAPAKVRWQPRGCGHALAVPPLSTDAD